MNKTDYLRKNGKLPKENFGKLYIAYFNKDKNIIELIEREIWDVKEQEISTLNSNGNWVHSTYKKYKFNESPYEIDFNVEDNEGVSEGYATGFGDLLRWGYYAYRTYEESNCKYNELLKESVNWGEDKEIIMPIG